MSDIIITTEDLFEYLKIPDFDSKEDQEVAIKKVTQQGVILENEYLLLTAFELTYKEISIPQTLYVDANNVVYKRFYFDEETIFFKPFTYDDNDEIFDSEIFPEPLVELNIPEEIFNNAAYQFYINKENQIVASLEAVTLNNSKDYISFSVHSFSYLKEYPLLQHNYTSVYGVDVSDVIRIETNEKDGLVHRFPILTKTFNRGYRLSYYYKEKSNEVRTTSFLEVEPIALSVYFKNIETVLSFLNGTIFWYYNEYDQYQSKWRNRFLVELTHVMASMLSAGGNIKDKVSVIYHIPEPLYYAFDGVKSLWNILIKLAKGYVRNSFGINEEDLILKILRIIYYRETNVLLEATVKGAKRRERENTNLVRRHNSILESLIRYKVDGQLLLHKLIIGLDGEQFKTYIDLIWSIWKSSSYAEINPELNKKVNITSKSPVYIDYRSGKALGFHYDNAQINWEASQPEITIAANVRVGTKEVTKLRNIGDDKPRYIDVGDTEIIDVTEKQAYSYHPFAPVVLINSDNPKFILKDNDNTNLVKTKLPAFVLFANNEAAFWENTITGVEYGVDILTTVSGVANLYKVGRLVNILKKGKSLFFRTAQATKVITGVKAAVGLIEVSAGAANVLLKLTGVNDTELGKTISKYLFYLEMCALASEVTVLLKGKLTKTAKELVENDNFVKSLDDLVKKGEIDEGVSELVINEVSLMAGPREIGKLGGKVLRASQIRKLRGELKRKGILLILEEDLKIKSITNQFKTIRLNGLGFEKAQDLFYFMKKEGFAGAFDARTKQMVLGEKSTELVAFHEKAHLKHFEELGEAYHPLKTWQKETYVWEQIWSKKRDWTKEELELSLNYANRERKKAGIDIIKIKL